MIESAGVPAMSVVLVTPDNYSSLRAVVRHLRAQSVCHLLEIVIAAPSVSSLALDEADLSRFGQYQVDYLYGARSAVPRGDCAGLADLKSSLASWGVNYILVGPEGNLAAITDPIVRQQMQRFLPLVDELRAEGRLSVVYAAPADGIIVYQVNPAP